MAASGTTRHLKTFLQLVKEGQLHAPNLKTAHFWLHRGQQRSNSVMKKIVTKHLLALRWTNPNALVFLRDSPDTGEAHVEFELWNGRRSGFTVAKADNAERVVAKLMFAARDLGLDEADVRAVLDGEDFTVAEPKETVVEPSVAAAAVAAEPVEPEEARS